jgi:hypothetical protein
MNAILMKRRAGLARRRLAAAAVRSVDIPSAFGSKRYTLAVLRLTRCRLSLAFSVMRFTAIAMIDRQARARQAITGETYAKAYTECYTAPENSVIRDNAAYEHLAQSYDAIFGTRLSMIPAQKAAPSDAKQDYVARAAEDRGPAHTRLHEMALEHSRAHGLSYQQSYTRLFTSPENVALRAGIAAEAGVRTLTLDEARALSPSKPFPPYSSPGQNGPSNIGRSGAKPRGYAGG